MLYKSLVIKVIVVLIILITGYSLINTKDFNLEFLVNKDTSSIDVESVDFKGRLIKFPLNLYYIKGDLIVGETNYIVNKYTRRGDSGNLKIDKYNIQFIDKNALDFFDGSGYITGNTLDDSVESIYINIAITNKHTGKTESEDINAYPIQ